MTQVPVIVLPTAAEKERLEILIEECSEVIQAATKITRHGFDNYNPHTFVKVGDNRFHLEKEIGHLFNSINMLLCNNDVRILNIFHEQDNKSKTIHKWLRHQS